VQAVEHLLGAFHGEGRNDDLAAACVAVVDGLLQFGAALAFVFVVAVAIRAFQEKIVRIHGPVRIVDEELIGAAQVAGKKQAGPAAVAVEREFDEGGP